VVGFIGMDRTLGVKLMKRQAFNKFNPQELLSQLVRVLESAGLSDSAKEVRDVSKNVLEDWSKRREGMVSQSVRERRITNKLANEVVAATGWEVTLRGGNRGATAHFKTLVSFGSYTVNQIGAMMGRYEVQVKKILSSLPKGVSVARGDVKMKSGKPCEVMVDVGMTWRTEGKAKEVADYLESNSDIRIFDDWLDL